MHIILKEDDRHNHFMYNNVTVTIPRENCNFPTFHHNTNKK